MARGQTDWKCHKVKSPQKLNLQSKVSAKSFRTDESSTACSGGTGAWQNLLGIVAPQSVKAQNNLSISLFLNNF